jgi:hypothetical protein
LVPLAEGDGRPLFLVEMGTVAFLFLGGMLDAGILLVAGSNVEE